MLLALSIATFSCGGGSGSSSSPKGENPGVPTVVELRPTHNVAQTNSTVYLHARILDGNGVPVKNERVTFTNLSEPFGVIKTVLRVLGIQKPIGVLSTPVVKTNNLGIATVKLTSTTSGFATIQAEVNSGAGQVRDKKTIFFTTSLTPIIPPSPTIALHVDDGNGIPDQPDDFNLFKLGSPTDNQRSVRAVVRNGFGQPISGATVLFGSDSPTEVTFSGNSLLTNAAGEAVVTVTVNPLVLSNLERIVNITAQTTVNSTTIGNMVSLFIQPVTISSITVNAEPSVVATNGTSTVRATVIMLGAFPVPDGTAVAFETTCGFITPFAQTTNAVAEATFTAPSVVPAGPCTVTARVGGSSGSTDITITASTPLAVIPSVRTIGNPMVTDTADFSILGGIAPYKAFSDNPLLVTVPEDVAGNTVTATVVGVPATDTTVTITIFDSLGTSVNASLILDIAPVLPMAVIPSTQTLSNPTVGITAQYQVLGGTGGYSAFSNNPALVTVAVVDNIVTATVQGIPSDDTTVTISIFDSAASSTTASLVLDVGSTTPLNVLPAAVTLTGLAGAGDSVTFFISGGSGTYAGVFSNNTAVIPNPAIAGNQFTIDPSVVAASTAVTLTVSDNVGATTTVTVTVTPATSSMAVNPSAISVTEGATITFNIIGGSPQYAIYSSDTSILHVVGAADPNPLVTSNTTFTVDTLNAGSATITIVDSDARTVTAAVTVTASGGGGGGGAALAISPSSPIIAENVNFQVLLFQVTGGTPNYTINSTIANLVFNDNGAGGGTAGNGIRDGGEGGSWTVTTDGGTFNVTIPAGDIVALDTDVSLLVSDTGAENTSATITIQEAIP